MGLVMQANNDIRLRGYTRIMIPSEHSSSTMCRETTKPTVPTASSYAQWGNAAYILCLINTVVYCVSVVLFKDSSFFDSEWSKDGFCVSNRSIPYWNSHDLCLYADVILASICGLAYYKLSKQEGMEAANDLVFYNLFGIVAHGLGHGGIGSAMRDEELQARMDDDVPYLFTIASKESWAEVVKDLFFSQGAVLLIFWLCLMKASMRKSSTKTIFSLAFLAYIGALSTPASLGFTYTQTVLLIAFCVDQLARPVEEKGFEYYLYGMVVSLPLGIVGWAESTMCSSTIIHLGGHLLYDAYIPLSMLGFYLTCYNRSASETTPKLKAA